jgi:CTD kinase subunit alpha
VVTELLGPYTTERWAGVDELPWYGLIQSAGTESAQQPEGASESQVAVLDTDASAARFRSMFKKWMSPAALDLALHLLHYDPKRRATATEALASPYFTEEQPEARIPFE